MPYLNPPENTLRHWIKKTEQLVDCLIDSSIPAMIEKYEKYDLCIETLEKEKRTTQPKIQHTFDELLEHSAAFLKTPQKP